MQVQSTNSAAILAQAQAQAQQSVRGQRHLTASQGGKEKFDTRLRGSMSAPGSHGPKIKSGSRALAEAFQEAGTTALPGLGSSLGSPTALGSPLGSPMIKLGSPASSAFQNFGTPQGNNDAVNLIQQLNASQLKDAMSGIAPSGPTLSGLSPSMSQMASQGRQLATAVATEVQSIRARIDAAMQGVPKNSPQGKQLGELKTLVESRLSAGGFGGPFGSSGGLTGHDVMRDLQGLGMGVASKISSITGPARGARPVGAGAVAGAGAVPGAAAGGGAIAGGTFSAAPRPASVGAGAVAGGPAPSAPVSTASASAGAAPAVDTASGAASAASNSSAFKTMSSDSANGIWYGGPDGGATVGGIYSEKASYGGMTGIGHPNYATTANGGDMVISVNGLHGKNPAPTQVMALDSNAVMQANGGVWPGTPAEMQRVLNANPECILANVNAMPPQMARIAGIPAGTKVTILTGAEGIMGNPPRTPPGSQAMITNIDQLSAKHQAMVPEGAIMAGGMQQMMQMAAENAARAAALAAAERTAQETAQRTAMEAMTNMAGSAAAENMAINNQANTLASAGLGSFRGGRPPVPYTGRIPTPTAAPAPAQAQPQQPVDANAAMQQMQDDMMASALASMR